MIDDIRLWWWCFFDHHHHSEIVLAADGDAFFVFVFHGIRVVIMLELGLVFARFFVRYVIASDMLFVVDSAVHRVELVIELFEHILVMMTGIVDGDGQRVVQDRIVYTSSLRRRFRIS